MAAYELSRNSFYKMKSCTEVTAQKIFQLDLEAQNHFMQGFITNFLQ